MKSLHSLAILLHRQLRIEEAEAYVMQILGILEEKYGKGSLETFGTHQHLASLLHLQGKLEEAMDIIAWLVAARTAAIGEGHPDTTCSKEHLQELEAELQL